MSGMVQTLIEARCPHCKAVVPLDTERAFADEAEQLAACEARIDAHLAECPNAPLREGAA